MTLVWFALALIAAFVVYGLIVPSPYKRSFPAGLNDTAPRDGYLVPQEVTDPGEDTMFKRASTNIANDSLRRPANAMRDDPLFYEPHWGHSSGLVQGTLTIDAIENLPEQFRVGLFAQNASYPAVGRSGVTKDTDIGFAGHRFALKLKTPEALPNTYAPSGEANELDLLLVEGPNEADGKAHRFFVRDGYQLDMGASLKPPSLQTLRILSNWRNIAILLGVVKDAKSVTTAFRHAPISTTGWAGKAYFSLGPFALGDGAMKFALTPQQDHPVPHGDPMKIDLAGVNKERMEDWYKDGKDAVFTLSVQIATPDCIPDPGPHDPPKSVMAAEYCDLAWDETAAPYVPVGTLTLKADDTINTEDNWGQLQFNAWNTYPVMRPLGQLFRLRKHAHRQHANARVAHLYGGTPGALTGKCPFGDHS